MSHGSFDDVLAVHVGALGRGQLWVMLVASLCSVPMACILMLMVFTSQDPITSGAWECVTLASTGISSSDAVSVAHTSLVHHSSRHAKELYQDPLSAATACASIYQAAFPSAVSSSSGTTTTTTTTTAVVSGTTAEAMPIKNATGFDTNDATNTSIIMTPTSALLTPLRFTSDAALREAFCSLPSGSVRWTRPGTSLLSYYNLACGREWMVSVLNSLYFVGLAVGGMGFGWLSDRRGRWTSMYVCAAVATVTTVAEALAPSFWLHGACRLVGAAAIQGVGLADVVLVTEMVGPDYRGRVGILTQSFFILGECLLALLAALIRDWRALTLLCAGLAAAFLATAPLVPESPRWLAAAGRRRQAAQVLARLARMNGRRGVTVEELEAALEAAEGPNATAAGDTGAGPVEAASPGGKGPMEEEDGGFGAVGRGAGGGAAGGGGGGGRGGGGVGKLTRQHQQPQQGLGVGGAVCRRPSEEESGGKQQPQPQQQQPEHAGAGGHAATRVPVRAELGSQDIARGGAPLTPGGSGADGPGQVKGGDEPVDGAEAEARVPLLSAVTRSASYSASASASGMASELAPSPSASPPSLSRLALATDAEEAEKASCAEGCHLLSGRLAPLDSARSVAAAAAVAAGGGVKPARPPTSAVVHIQIEGPQLLAGDETEAHDMSHTMKGPASCATALPASPHTAPGAPVGARHAMPTLRDAARSALVLCYFGVLSFALCTLSLSYYGIGFALSYIPGSLYVSFFLISIAEAPSSALVGLLIDRLGRCTLVLCGMAISGLACIACGLAEGAPVAQVLLAMTGKFGCSGAWSVLVVYCAEVFPTSVRSLLSGAIFQGARVGGVAAPFVFLLGTSTGVLQLPFWLMGMLTLAAAALCVVLPETGGSQQPESLADMEARAGRTPAAALAAAWAARRWRRTCGPCGAAAAGTGAEAGAADKGWAATTKCGGGVMGGESARGGWVREGAGINGQEGIHGDRDPLLEKV